ncbi:MAG: hypothetical protein Q7O66_07465 [Dehalococcoidia bacterium]|nr:hypothetical protein [Dehalococcoidia bacterium]
MIDLDRRLAIMTGWTYTETQDVHLGTLCWWSNPVKGLTYPHTPPSYSADIGACFSELVPWLAAPEREWKLHLDAGVAADEWTAEFRWSWGERDHKASALTPEMAIALAAEAVGKAEGWAV